MLKKTWARKALEIIVQRHCQFIYSGNIVLYENQKSSQNMPCSVAAFDPDGFWALVNEACLEHQTFHCSAANLINLALLSQLCAFTVLLPWQRNISARDMVFKRAFRKQPPGDLSGNVRFF